MSSNLKYNIYLQVHIRQNTGAHLPLPLTCNNLTVGRGGAIEEKKSNQQTLLNQIHNINTLKFYGKPLKYDDKTVKYDGNPVEISDNQF